MYAVAVNADDAPGPTNEAIGVSDNVTLDLETRAAAAEGNATGDPDDDREQTAASADATPSNESTPTVISPDPASNETPGGTSSDDDVGGVPFAVLSLAAVIAFLIIRGPADAD